MRLNLTVILLLFAAFLRTQPQAFAAENIKAVGPVAKANVKAVGPVVEANIKSLGPVDNTTGGGGGVTLSDDFNRANNANLGANWSILSGTIAIDANEASITSTAWAEVVHAHNTSLASANGYIKVTLIINDSEPNNNYPAVFFRVTNASSPMYGVFFWDFENSMTFIRKATAADASFQDVQAVAHTVANGQTWGVTWTGSGNDVVVRCWLNPTANAPVSASEWDSGDTTPEVSFSNNPTTPVDSGNFIGIGGEPRVSGVSEFDNLYAGSLP